MLEKGKKLLSSIKSLRSFRLRIFLVVFCVGVLPSILMRFGIVETYEERAVSHRTSTVQTQLRILTNHLIFYNYLQDTSSEVINAELDMLSNLYDGRVIIIAENFKVVKDTYGINEGKTVISEEVMKSFGGESMYNYDRENGYIEMTTPITETNTNRESGEEVQIVRGVMLTSISTESITSTMDILNRNAFLFETLMVIVIFAVAMGTSILLSRPFRNITQSINSMSEGYMDIEIAKSYYSETTQIVEAFNSLLQRMKVLDDSRQEFVANVSHELKTPLASMKVLADSLVAQKDAPLELYQEFMEDITEEIDRENQIITDLLALVKMDKKVADLNISSVDINALTELILKRLRPIARKKDIEIVYESVRNVQAEVDEVKMSLILSNLVENAIKYNQEHGSVRVVLDADYQFFTFEVTDTGIGIPKDALEHIYERFYRVDKSHSREIGGTGLGLAIAKSAVLMHRGTIKVTSVEGEGTTFLVKIPLNHIVEKRIV